MSSVSLCVRVVFKWKRPSNVWLDEQADLFGVDGSWVSYRVCKEDVFAVGLGSAVWEGTWLADGPIPTNNDERLSTLCHLRAVGEAIEEAWERENAPKAEAAGSGPASWRCPVCKREA